VIKFVSKLQQVCGFLRVLQFPPQIKLAADMLELYLGHVETCGYRKIKCCFSRCGQMILLKDKEQHENKDCDFREKLCTGRCGLMIPEIKLAATI
jgi:hypothetical protein